MSKRRRRPSLHRDLVRWVAGFTCEAMPFDCRTYDQIVRTGWRKGELCLPCRAWRARELMRKAQTRNAARARRKAGRR